MTDIPREANVELLRTLKTSGPLRFDRFMHLVLYSAPWGFYRRHTPGQGVAYQTSSTLSPWFARLLSIALVRMWKNLGSPPEMTVVEVGGGSGDFAKEVAMSLPEDVSPCLRWIFVEPFDQIAAKQKRAVQRSPGRFEWAEKLESVEPIKGCIFANEVLDNFPARVFEVADEGLLELYVSAEGSGASELLLPLHDDDPAPEAAEAVRHLEVGDRFELKPMLEGWVHQASATVSSGYLLLIDYGDVQPTIWTRRPSGSVVAYKGEAISADPLEGLGSKDITSHVDFTALTAYVRAAGFEHHHLRTQREFLEMLGLPHALEGLRSAEERAKAEGDFGGYLATIAERSKAHSLAAPGLGDLLVLLATKAAPPLQDQADSSSIFSL